jgi:hypothetical protein
MLTLNQVGNDVTGELLAGGGGGAETREMSVGLRS